MRVFVESILPCNADCAWTEVQKCALLIQVARPIVTFRPVHGESLPERWIEGMTVRCRSFLLGLIPLGTRTLYFDRVDSDRMEILTHEHDSLVKRWDHLIRARPLVDGKCKYSDTIEIDAGLLTPVVSLFAYFFYKHRQRRWQTVAKRLQTV